jgi:dUTP pyrophosphatase
MATALQQSGFILEKEETTQVCNLKIKLLDPDAKCPVQASPEAAGFDISSQENLTIAPGEQSKISTKLALEIPLGYHGQLLVQSGYAAKYCARVEAGVIDSDYRGEVFVLISNSGTKEMVINKGNQIAQMIIVQDLSVSLSVTTELSATT